MEALNLTKHIYLVQDPEISHFTICQTFPDLNSARSVNLEQVAFLSYELGLLFSPYSLPSFTHSHIHAFDVGELCMCECTCTMVHRSEDNSDIVLVLIFPLV